MVGRKSLVRRIYEFLGPDVVVDNQNRTFGFRDEGLFLEHLTEAYYIFRGYQKIEIDS